MTLLLGNPRVFAGFRPHMPHPGCVDAQWGHLRQQALDLLFHSGQNEAHGILKEYAWAPYIATRGMREDVEILYAEVTPRENARLEFVLDNAKGPSPFAEIASALKNVGFQPLFIVAVPLRPETQQVRAEPLTMTPQAVQAAIDEAERSLKAGHPGGAVDRMHTALHGYLRETCSSAGLLQQGESDLRIQALWKRINEKHPAFAKPMPHGEHTMRVMSGIGTALDSLNPLRNHGSLAHPNPALIEGPEAWLLVDLCRSVLNYVKRRVEHKP